MRRACLSANEVAIAEGINGTALIVIVLYQNSVGLIRFTSFSRAVAASFACQYLKLIRHVE